MVEVIAAIAVLGGLYALWVVGWPDLLRVVQGVRHVWGTVVRHDQSSDGFVPVFAFEHDGRMREVRGFTAHASPTPAVGTRHLLNHPARRPDLARPPQTFQRALLYGGFAAWLALFSDLWLDWM